MEVEKTIQTNLAEFSRCDNRSWLAVEEQNVDHKADQTDASIAEKVDRALWNNDMLRSTDYDEIDIDVKDGIVFLSGHVISASIQQQAEDAVRTIPGVLDVKSYLVPDDKITWEVAEALGKIEHIYGVKFFTGVNHGVVGLNGEITSANVRSLAEKCAANIPGVRGVIDHMRSSIVNNTKEDRRFLQPAIGKQIYFRDGRSGKVQKVIINPNNRRVVSMLVQGQYPISQHETRFTTYADKQAPERLLVIPMSAIRYLTKSSGFLNVENGEATRYSDFDPSFFIVPREDWIPPYPYCRDEVLFPAETVVEINQTEEDPAIIPNKYPRVQSAMQSGIPEEIGE